MTMNDRASPIKVNFLRIKRRNRLEQPERRRRRRRRRRRINNYTCMCREEKRWADLKVRRSQISELMITFVPLGWNTPVLTMLLSANWSNRWTTLGTRGSQRVEPHNICTHARPAQGNALHHSLTLSLTHSLTHSLTKVSSTL